MPQSNRRLQKCPPPSFKCPEPNRASHPVLRRNNRWNPLPMPRIQVRSSSSPFQYGNVTHHQVVFLNPFHGSQNCFVLPDCVTFVTRCTEHGSKKFPHPFVISYREDSLRTPGREYSRLPRAADARFARHAVRGKWRNPGRHRCFCPAVLDVAWPRQARLLVTSARGTLTPYSLDYDDAGIRCRPNRRGAPRWPLNRYGYARSTFACCQTH